MRLGRLRGGRLRDGGWELPACHSRPSRRRTVQHFPPQSGMHSSQRLLGPRAPRSTRAGSVPARTKPQSVGVGGCGSSGLRQRCWPVRGALAALAAEPMPEVVPVPDVPVDEPVPAAPPVAPVCEGLVVSDEDGDVVPEVVPLVPVLPPVLLVPELAASRPVEPAEDVSVPPAAPGSLRLQATNAAAVIKVMARFLVSDIVFMVEFLGESKEASTGRWHAQAMHQLHVRNRCAKNSPWPTVEGGQLAAVNTQAT